MELFVVIPCHNEPDIVATLDSLATCQPPHANVHVIVIINSGENDVTEVLLQNEQTQTAIEAWRQHKPSWIDLTVKSIKDVPKKLAGVGHARKLGMDLAASLAKKPTDCIIVCFDADCMCSPNYLSAIENSFERNTDRDVATIYFEHDVTDNPAIVNYELFLRYHLQGLRYAGYPFAYQTIGSSMAVRANTYSAFGGMNTRKAGEDFYFLHKIIPYRNVLEINDCAVYPSGRSSDRVPFGTGHAVEKHNTSSCRTYYTYHPAIYTLIKQFVDVLNQSTLKGIDNKFVPQPIREFLAQEHWSDTEAKLIKQSKTDAIFQQNVYRWLNGFRMLKLVHFLRDKYYINIPINEAVQLFWQTTRKEEINQSNLAWLSLFRSLERTD